MKHLVVYYRKKGKPELLQKEKELKEGQNYAETLTYLMRKARWRGGEIVKVTTKITKEVDIVRPGLTFHSIRHARAEVIWKVLHVARNNAWVCEESENHTTCDFYTTEILESLMRARFKGVVQAVKGKLLLGGVKTNVSVPFLTYKEASDWLWTAGQQTNADINRSMVVMVLVKISTKNEILD